MTGGGSGDDRAGHAAPMGADAPRTPPAGRSPARAPVTPARGRRPGAPTADGPAASGPGGSAATTAGGRRRRPPVTGSGGPGPGAAPRPSGAGAEIDDAILDAGNGPASRRALRSQGRRTMRKLLDAAMQVFDERGYHATRVNDVVEAADTSHGTFYLYFSNKEDLLRALVIEATTEGQQLRGALLGRPEGGASREELRMWIGRHSSFWTRYGPLLRAWTDLSMLDPALRHKVREMLDATIDSLAAHVANAHPDGVEPRAAAMAVLGMVGRFHQLREFLDEPIDDEALDTLTTIVYRALFDPASVAV